MNKNFDEIYVSPVVEVLELVTESGFCASDGGGTIPPMNENSWD